MFLGEPRPEYAMLVAQNVAAEETCSKQGLVSEEESKLFSKEVARITASAERLEKDPDIRKVYDEYLANYRAALGSASKLELEGFCIAYGADIEKKKIRKFLWFEALMNVVRFEFSPRSASSEKKVGIITMFATGVSIVGSAASISQNISALNAGKAGDLGRMQSLSNSASAISNAQVPLNNALMGAATTYSGPIVLVSNVRNDDGKKTVIRCPLSTRFRQFDASPEAKIWKTYQGVGVSEKCRLASSSDVERIMKSESEKG